MRKTSQDGGDSYSITSGVENELKKPLMSLLKSKKGSLKRKPPSSSKESDDTVVEPLLNKDKEKPGTSQSAKFFTKPKTEDIFDKVDEKSKLINDNKIQNTTSSPIITSINLSKEIAVTKSVSTSAPIHNYMNTNVFNAYDGKKVDVTPKSQILVEIDNSKPSGYTPSPLIFTTAKIHTDGKTKHMEPVQVTPVPILSTVEASLSKGGSITTNEKKVMNASNGTPLISTVYSTNVITKNDTKPNTSLFNTATAAQTKDTDKSVTTNQSKTAPNNSVISQPQKSSNNIISIVTTKSATETIANSQEKETQSQKTAATISSSTLDQTKATISNQTTKLVTQSQPVLQPQHVLHSSTNQNQTIQNNKSIEKTISDKPNTNFESVQIVDCKPKELHSNKSGADSSTIPISTSSSSKTQTKTVDTDTKQSQMPKNSTIDDTSKIKKPPDVISSIKASTEKPTNSSAKVVSSSIKQPISTLQSKTNNSNVSKDTDKTPKTSANEVKLTISKPVQNTTANTSINKAAEKSVIPAVSGASTGGINIKNKNQPLTVKPSNTSKTDNVTTSNLPKSVSTTKSISLTKTVPSTTPLTMTSKSTAASSTKPTSKVTTVTSQKPSGINIASSSATIKQPAASTGKVTSAISSVTKTSAITTSNPVTTKPSSNKPTQVSSKSDATSSTVTPTTTIAATSSNGIAKPDVKKVTKPNDVTSKVSKA